jgi:hypothetical protein
VSGLATRRYGLQGHKIVDQLLRFLAFLVNRPVRFLHASPSGLSVPAEFSCNACRKVLNQPLSMPCGHNFCKGCLESRFAGQDSSRERKGVSGRSLRTQKIVKLCPIANCKYDITDCLVSPQVQCLFRSFSLYA